jgi:hypothetical protein
MKPKEEHKIKLREICDLAFSYGRNTILLYIKKYSLPNPRNKETKK